MRKHSQTVGRAKFPYLSMFPVARHFQDASGNAVCAIWESEGAVGGSSMLWSMVGACTTRHSSVMVLRQLIDVDGVSDIASHNVAVSPEVHVTAVGLRAGDDAQSAIQRAVDLDERRHPGSRQRLILFESATTLSFLLSFGAVFRALLQLSMSPHVHGIIALFQAAVHSQTEVEAIQRLSSCNLLLKPASSLNSDLALATMGRRVHLEAVCSFLRHSGTMSKHVSIADTELVPIRCSKAM